MNRVPRFDLDGGDPKLRCPHCGSYGHLHHGAVTVYARKADATTGLRVRVDGETAQIDRCLAGNPSLWRDGFSVAFSCEDCNLTYLLEFLQHKGETYAYWSVGGRK